MSAPYPIIDVKNISKHYKLGTLGAHSLKESLAEAWAKWVKKEPIDYQEDQYGIHTTFVTKDTDKELWALKNVSLQVEAGEMVGVIGRNGAGKSTLLKILSRVTYPTYGKVELRGRTASLLEVGTGFHPDLTGRENVFLNGAILGMTEKEIQSQFDAIIDFSGVERFLETPIKRYSSGMRLRLAFAVAAHLNAEIVIVDEVLAVGDAVFQKKCMDKMKERAQLGRTVLFVSHQLAVLGALCPRAIWLHQGAVQADGASGEVLSKYLQSMPSSGSQKKWDENIQLNSVAQFRNIKVVKSNSESLVSEATIDDELCLHIEIENFQEKSDLMCYLTITDGQENILFQSAPMASTSAHADPHLEAPYEKGRHLLVCDIPANLLTQGHYAVNLYLAKNMHNILHATEKEITFTVNDTPDWHVRYHQRWPGLVRPRLSWKREKITS
jgi:lipopolysaccharide transport system ATP-binding protein